MSLSPKLKSDHYFGDLDSPKLQQDFSVIFNSLLS